MTNLGVPNKDTLILTKHTTKTPTFLSGGIGSSNHYEHLLIMGISRSFS